MYNGIHAMEETERRRALKKKYREQFAELARIFAEDDPKGLINDDNSNLDEYELEVGTILPRLSSCDSREDVQVVIAEEFNRWFSGEGGSPESHRAVAERVWSTWCERGWMRPSF